MKCMSREWIIMKDEKGNIKGKHTCEKDATKVCKHIFYTCEKHYHGCNTEKELMKE